MPSSISLPASLRDQACDLLRAQAEDAIHRGAAIIRDVRASAEAERKNPTPASGDWFGGMFSPGDDGERFAACRDKWLEMSTAYGVILGDASVADPAIWDRAMILATGSTAPGAVQPTDPAAFP